MIAEGLRARLGLLEDRNERHAVIDIGSNTVRLVVYGGPPRAPAVLWNEKVSARLGRDLAKNGAIPASAMKEALTALARFAAIIAELKIARVETVATAAPREATNGPDFVRRVEGLGLAVRVLSGEEEACASAYGAIGAFPDAEGIVADLGGGSLELISIANGACGDGASLPLGTLRLPELRRAGGFDGAVGKLLKTADWGGSGGPMYMIGGTWRALALFAMRSAEIPLTDPHGLTLGCAEALAIADEVMQTKPARLMQRGISTMRAEKLPDAAALLRVLIDRIKPDGLIFSSWGLREGLYYRTLAPREQAADPLLAAVTAFAIARGGDDGAATLLARWASATAVTQGPAGERLRLAAAHLALALHRVEPNLRPAQALEWALDKRWIGIDFSGRAMLGGALRGSLGITEPHRALAQLASESDLHEATAWGLAYRLAQRLGAGASGPLTRSRLTVADQSVTLALNAADAALVSGPVEKNLGTLASWLGASPAVSAE